MKTILACCVLIAVGLSPQAAVAKKLRGSQVPTEGLKKDKNANDHEPEKLDSKYTKMELADLQELSTTGEKGRALMPDAGHHPVFEPLACNANLANATCSSWEAFLQGQPSPSTSTVKIPCGQCVVLDAPGLHDLPHGLNVEGRLHVPVDDLPADFETEIRTPVVLVQGILEITSSRIVNGSSPQALAFTMIDESKTHFLSDHVHPQNAAACDGNGGCKVGTKAFVVAGGTLDVRALPPNCPSWVSLEERVTRGVTVPPNGSFPSLTTIAEEAGVPGECDLAVPIVSESFESSSGANGWNGNYNPGGFELSSLDSHTPGESYLWVHGRTKPWHGPLSEIDIGCMIPDALYTLRAKIKTVITPEHNHTSTGTETSAAGISRCADRGEGCLGATYYRKDSSGQAHWRGLGGQLYGSADGEWYDLITTYKFTPDDLEPGQVHRLYFDGPEAGIDVMIDDIVMELADETFYPPAPAQCQELIYNGDGEAHPPFTYPFKTNAYKTRLSLEAETSEASSTTNHFFRQQDRYGSYHSAEYLLPTSCLTDGDTYTLSMNLRLVNTTTPGAITPKVLLKSEGVPSDSSTHSWDVIAYCPPQTDQDGWVTCTTDHVINEHQASAEVVKLYVEINEDLNAVVDYDDVSFAFKYGPTVGLVLPNEGGAGGIESCWGAGSEILITSHTIQWDDDSVRTIESVSPVPGGDGDVEVTLNEPISSVVTTRVEEAQHGTAKAVEVGLLSRTVSIRAEDDGSKLGGHFFFYHTPHVRQTVEGLEMRRLGRAGELGRYPLHFHMCGDVDGSLVSKNVVRESHQRCYVLHGSHNVTLSENLAYDTFGHCYFLEDGAEMDNEFYGNLGARTKRQPTEDVITKQPETDHDCSTFWLTNPQNTWEGNVAAGSEHSGFWFEFRDHVRGASGAMSMGMNPREMPLRHFNDNVAHSNAEHGLKTYPGSGYAPLGDQAVFRNTASYRNKGSGVFFHNSRNLAVEGGFYADNRRQIDFDRAPTTRASNAVVTGYSPLYRSVVEAEGTNWYQMHCPSSNPLVGVQFHTFWGGGPDHRGSVVENVHFQHLGEEDTGCDGTVAINVDAAENKGFFDPRSSVTGLTYDATTEPFELCTAAASTAEGGPIDFVAIRDVDGSLMGGTTSGYVISDSDRMTSLLDPGACTAITASMNGNDTTTTCALGCPDLCLRAKMYKVESQTPDDLKLVIVDLTDPSKTLEVYGYREEHNNADGTPDVNEDRRVFHHRVFHVLLPETGGPYDAHFESNGQLVWPRYVEDYDDDVPGNCGSGPAPLVRLIEPAGEDMEALCSDLVINGDVESGLDGWLHNDGGVATTTPGAGTPESTTALTSTGRTASWNGPAQFLDSRCLRTEGDVYQIRAKVKMDHDPGCNWNTGDGTNCPKVTVLVTMGRDEDADRRWHGVSLSTATRNWDQGQWNEVVGTFEVDLDMTNSKSVLFWFEGPPAGVDILLDDVSISPYVEEEDDACDGVIVDETFTDSTNGWNGNWNPGGFELTDADSHTPGDSYLWIHGRTKPWHGPLASLDISCIVPNVPYSLTARVKTVLTPEFTGEVSNCFSKRENCLGATYYRKDLSGQSHWRGMGGQMYMLVEDGQWYNLTTSYTFTEEDLTLGEVHRLYFDGPEEGIDIMIDDIRLERMPDVFLPSEETLANDLIVNGAADMLPPHIYPFKANGWRTTLLNEEEVLPDGSINYYFSQKVRYSGWMSAEQWLPTYAITAGESRVFSVRLRVHTSVVVQPKVLLFSQTDPAVNADKQWKLLTSCPQQTEVDGWVTCTSTYTFTDHQANAGLLKLYVEVPQDINAVVDYDDFSFIAA